MFSWIKGKEFCYSTPKTWQGLIRVNMGCEFVLNFQCIWERVGNWRILHYKYFLTFGTAPCYVNRNTFLCKNYIKQKNGHLPHSQFESQSALCCLNSPIVKESRKKISGNNTNSIIASLENVKFKAQVFYKIFSAFW